MGQGVSGLIGSASSCVEAFSVYRVPASRLGVARSAGGAKSPRASGLARAAEKIEFCWVGLSHTVGKRVRSTAGCLSTALDDSLSVWVVGRLKCWDPERRATARCGEGSRGIAEWEGGCASSRVRVAVAEWEGLCFYGIGFREQVEY